MEATREKYRKLVDLIGKDKAQRLLDSWLTRVYLRESKLQGVDKTKEFEGLCNRVIHDLCNRTGLYFEVGKYTKVAIDKLIKKGYSEEDFKRVHQIKTEDWLNVKDQEKYLAPGTLYRDSNFPRYLEQWNMKQQLLLKEQADKERKKQLERNKRLQQQQKYQEEEKMNAETVHNIISKTIEKVKKQSHMTTNVFD